VTHTVAQQQRDSQVCGLETNTRKATTLSGVGAVINSHASALHFAEMCAERPSEMRVKGADIGDDVVVKNKSKDA
jgi:hypothetical protein